MDLQLQNKTALISGSTAGIGLSIAQCLAKEGASVIINGRTKERVEEALKQIDGDASGIDADLSTNEGAEKVFQAYPHVDILINNLGIYETSAFEDISDATWLKMFDVNVLSGIRLSRLYMPKMQRNNWGRILFISSESAINIPSEMIHYGLTKTAQLSLSRGLAQICSGTGVTVNAVLPGPTHSEGVTDFLEQIAKEKKQDIKEVEKEFFQTMRGTSIIKRFAETKEVADVVTFLASPLSSAITGASIRVDGGVISSIY